MVVQSKGAAQFVSYLLPHNTKAYFLLATRARALRDFVKIELIWKLAQRIRQTAQRDIVKQVRRHYDKRTQQGRRF
jgi:hypothetical protein